MKETLSFKGWLFAWSYTVVGGLTVSSIIQLVCELTAALR